MLGGSQGVHEERGSTTKCTGMCVGLFAAHCLVHACWYLSREAMVGGGVTSGLASLSPASMLPRSVQLVQVDINVLLVGEDLQGTP